MNLPNANLDAAAPPEEYSNPQKALWWLAKGQFKTGPEWEQGHAICQSAEGRPEYDYVHALAHWIEGDKWNSDYWYGRVGTERQSEDPAEEWRFIAEALATPA